MIKDLGKLWGHLKEGYGRLIAFYAKLIIQKINFHRKVFSIEMLSSEHDIVLLDIILNSRCFFIGLIDLFALLISTSILNSNT